MTINTNDTQDAETITAWYPTAKPLSQPTHAFPSPGEATLLEKDLEKDVVLATRYRIGERLGAGGFATVYSAWDLLLRRWVAVKITAGAEAGRMSADEARLQATCQHPNIMPLHDAGQDPLLGVTFLVMPLYPGADLAGILNRYGSMPYRSALLCLDQICSALEFLQQRRQTVHGDLKPANIWLTPGGSALLMDFNLQSLLVRGEILRAGTPGYTAPEALEGQIGPASDVFSLGCVLYACLTGVAPFADDRAVRAGAYTPVRQLRPDIRPELEAVLRTAIAADPQQRYQSAREFQTALRRPARQSGFALFLLGTLFRKAGRGIAILYRTTWRILRTLTRHLFRRPKQAFIETVIDWLIGRYLWQTTQIWFLQHRTEVRIATIATLITAGIGTTGYLLRLRRMWSAGAPRTTTPATIRREPS